MVKVMMYATRTCPFCRRAEQYLERKGIGQIDKKLVDLDLHALEDMIEKCHTKTVPQIFIGETHIGGFKDLVRYDREGWLERLLYGYTLG